MADAPNLKVTAQGVFADHPPRLLLPAKVAPTLDQESNRLRDPLITVACAKAADYLFEFDRSFLRPDVAQFMISLAELRERFPNSPLSIFGHTDPVGTDDYNAHLGGRRAAAYYGLLTRDADLWDDIYQNAGQRTQICVGDQWGPKSFQQMLSVIPDNNGNPYYSGDFDDTWNPTLQAALDQFSKDKSVSPGPARRKAIYQLYMDVVCRDGKGNKFQLQPTEFLAQGQGEKGKGDFQGCGKSNPQLVFSQEEDAFFQANTDKHTKEQRDQENQPNRRVVILFFRDGTRIDPTKWPCPNVHEAGAHASCVKRYWHNGEERRNPQEVRRKFDTTEDTFACRFYHGLTFGSPCEDTPHMWNLRVLFRPPIRTEGGGDDDELVLPFADRRYVLIMSQNPEGMQIRGTTDANGRIGIPVVNEIDKDKPRITLKVDFNWFDDGPGFFQPKIPQPQTNAPAGGNDNNSSATNAASNGSSGASTTSDPSASGGSNGTGAGPANSAGGGSGANTGAGGADPNAPFPGEDRFLKITLDAGDLLVVDAPDLEPGGLPKAQRLSNLSYLAVPGDPDGKDGAASTAAENRFKRDQQLAADAQDADVRAQLKKVHGG